MLIFNIKILQLNNFGDVTNVNKFIGKVINGKMLRKNFRDWEVHKTDDFIYVFIY